MSYSILRMRLATTMSLQKSTYLLVVNPCFSAGLICVFKLRKSLSTSTPPAANNCEARPHTLERNAYLNQLSRFLHRYHPVHQIKSTFFAMHPSRASNGSKPKGPGNHQSGHVFASSSAARDGKNSPGAHFGQSRFVSLPVPSMPSYARDSPPGAQSKNLAVLDTLFSNVGSAVTSDRRDDLHSSAYMDENRRE